MNERLVTYKGQPIRLTVEEYVELRELAMEDPVAADSRALDLLRRMAGR